MTVGVRARLIFVLIIATWTSVFMGWLGLTREGHLTLRRVTLHPFTKSDLARVLGHRLTNGKGFTGHEVLTTERGALDVEYSIDMKLQNSVEEQFRKGKVDYGSFVAIDPQTGQILSMVSYNPFRVPGLNGVNMALRATYPAASVFKVITAASAIENGKLKPDSMIPLLGRNHTLYKRSLFRSGGLTPDGSPRYARLISFEDALAKSINSIFGKVGIFGVGHEGLMKTADRFQFNHKIPLEMDLDESHVEIPSDDYGLAEAASGFTKKTVMSPVHGAMIAAAVANGGIMMEPSIVSQVSDVDGINYYRFKPTTLATVTDKNSVVELREMMHRTVTNGTSRKSFRGAERSIALSQLFVGGKTGTLRGTDPPGQYDWFIGFAEGPEGHRLAVATLCIHGLYHGVKAAYVARKAFENYFMTVIASRESGI